MQPLIAARVRLILACLVGCALHAIGVAGDQDPGPKESRLSLFVVRPGLPMTPLKQPVIGSTTVVVAPNDTLETLLKRNGIHPDVEAVGMIYALNPGLKDLNKLPKKLTLPVAEGAEASAILKTGGLVAVVREKALKEQFVRHAASAADNAERFAKLDKERFASPEERVMLTNLVTKAAGNLDAFRLAVKGQTRPLTPDLVQQLEGEAAILDKILGRAVTSTDRLSAEDKVALERIGKSMDLRLKSLNQVMGAAGVPPRWPEVKVIVRTIDAKGVEKNNLQVYVVPEALYGRRGYTQVFDRVSSPTDRWLPEAYYFIWAANPNANPKKEYGRKNLTVIRRDGKDEIPVDIVVP